MLNTLSKKLDNHYHNDNNDNAAIEPKKKLPAVPDNVLFLLWSKIDHLVTKTMAVTLSSLDALHPEGILALHLFQSELDE